ILCLEDETRQMASSVERRGNYFNQASLSHELDESSVSLSSATKLSIITKNVTVRKLSLELLKFWSHIFHPIMDYFPTPHRGALEEQHKGGTNYRMKLKIKGYELGSRQEESFQKIKEILTAAPVLVYYDVCKPVTITCDASKSGLGAVLLQDSKPVAYASRALTDAETRYAQIEKELLAVVFGFERFNQYTYARPLEVEKDHKPLEAITKKPLSMAPPRLQRMLLRLQRYDFIVKYKPGKEIVFEDTLSRTYVPNSEPDESHMEDEVEYHTHSVFHRIPVLTDKLEKIREETSKDPTMMVLLTVIRRGWPQSRQQTPVEIHQFWNYRDEMSEIEGVIMKGDRIVTPTVLRSEMLARVHDSHIGIEKCRGRARYIIFWPKMNEQINDLISKCNICQEHQSSNPKESLIESPLPGRPLETVATNLFHWEQKDYLLVVDYYSRYVEVAKLDDTKSRTVVNHTNPYYPKSNGLAEKAVQTVKRLLTKVKADGENPYLSLLDYRNTPIDDVGSPSQLLMSRRLKSILPTTTSQLLQPQIVNPKAVEHGIPSVVRSDIGPQYTAQG
ncbi:retrotransposon-like family member retr-1, partial [Paramuricea clavata]